jgi:hypothetical protein
LASFKYTLESGDCLGKPSGEEGGGKGERGYRRGEEEGSRGVGGSEKEKEKR